MARLDDSAGHYRALYDTAKAGLPGLGLDWLERLRAEAIERFAATGFPTARTEAWKYTNLQRLARTTARLAPAGRVDAARLAPWTLGDEAARLVFVNGRHDPELSRLPALPAGIEVTTLGRTLDADGDSLRDRLGRQVALDERRLAALNTAFMTDGIVLRLRAGVTVPGPIHVFHIATGDAAPFMVPPRNLILAEAGSAATVVESFVDAGGGAYWTNAVTEIAVGANADIRHVRVQAEGREAHHVGLVEVRVERAGCYRALLLSTGALVARNEYHVILDGEGAEAEIDGASLLDGRRHADATTVIEHRKPHGRSRQVFKNVVDETARAVFQGRVLVAVDAQKTNAHQLSRSLLLAPGAQADAKPELQIFADDVKCSHGSTVGALDATALFYLRSRGIDAPTARALLIEAFVTELIEDWPTGAVRDHIGAVLRSALRREPGGTGPAA